MKQKFICRKCGAEAESNHLQVEVEIDAALYNEILDITSYENTLYENFNDFIRSALRKEILFVRGKI